MITERTAAVRLLSMKIDEIKVEPEKYNHEKRDDLSFDVKFVTGAESIEDNTMLARIEISLEENDKNLITLTLSGLFEVEKEDWAKFVSDNKVIFPRGFLLEIFPILYNTARGALLMRNNNNKLKSITLPLADAASFLKQDHIIQFD